MCSQEVFVHYDPDAGFFERSDTAVLVKCVRYSAEIVAEWVVCSDITFKIAGIVCRGQHMYRRGHVDASG